MWTKPCWNSITASIEPAAHAAAAEADADGAHGQKKGHQQHFAAGAEDIACLHGVCIRAKLHVKAVSYTHLRYFYITDAGQERIDAFLDEWDEVKRIYAFIKGEEV